MCSMRRGTFTDDQIMTALNETHGMVFLAAERLGCSHITIQRRSLSTPAVRTLIEKWRGRLVDKSELKLEAAIDNGEPWAVAMTLKTRGKDRGYVERQEHTGAEGEPLIALTFVDVVRPMPIGDIDVARADGKE